MTLLGDILRTIAGSSSYRPGSATTPAVATTQTGRHVNDDVALPAGYSWGHAPATHGLGWDREPVAGGRRVLRIPGRTWQWAPELCRDNSHRIEWVLDEVGVCRGCGLDST